MLDTFQSKRRSKIKAISENFSHVIPRLLMWQKEKFSSPFPCLFEYLQFSYILLSFRYYSVVKKSHEKTSSELVPNREIKLIIELKLIWKDTDGRFAKLQMLDFRTSTRADYEL